MVPVTTERGQQFCFPLPANGFSVPENVSRIYAEEERVRIWVEERENEGTETRGWDENTDYPPPLQSDNSSDNIDHQCGAFVSQ